MQFTKNPKELFTKEEKQAIETEWNEWWSVAVNRSYSYIGMWQERHVRTLNKIDEIETIVRRYDDILINEYTVLREELRQFMDIGLLATVNETINSEYIDQRGIPACNWLYEFLDNRYNKKKNKRSVEELTTSIKKVKIEDNGQESKLELPSLESLSLEPPSLFTKEEKEHILKSAGHLFSCAIYRPLYALDVYTSNMFKAHDPIGLLEELVLRYDKSEFRNELKLYLIELAREAKRIIENSRWAQSVANDCYLVHEILTKRYSK